MKTRDTYCLECEQPIGRISYPEDNGTPVVFCDLLCAWAWARSNHFD